MPLFRIQKMLDCCATKRPLFPPTDLYNEGWMLRLLLDWFAEHPTTEHLLAISERERWYSEALLPSTFLARYRGDQYAEAWTHADGVIGEFCIGKNGSGDLALNADAGSLVVLEAKMFSKLSAGVTHAGYYNQAARNVACMAEVLRRAKRHPSMLGRLSFFVIAPQEQVDRGVFDGQMNPASIEKTVIRRIDDYDQSKGEWFDAWFKPTMKHIKIDVVSWEMLLEHIAGIEEKTGQEFEQFYDLCLEFNRRKESTL